MKDNDSYYADCARILKALFSNEKYKTETRFIDDASSDGQPELAQRRDTASSSTGTHSHRHALKAVFKSPSITKLSQHLPHSRHQPNSPSSPKSSGITTPISSPPTFEKSKAVLFPGTKIVESDTVLPPPSIPTTTGADTTPSTATEAPKPTEATAPLPNSKHHWTLKGFVSVIRHADRTPKAKIKLTAHSEVFVDLLKGHHEEVLLKGEAALASVEAAVKTAQRQNIEDQEKLRNLRNALAKKGSHPATKVQIKPIFRKRRPEEMLPSTTDSPSLNTAIPEHSEADAPIRATSSPAIDEVKKTPTRSDSISGATFSRYSAQDQDLILDKLQLVMKWGGEPTHSARYQSAELSVTLVCPLVSGLSHLSTQFITEIRGAR